MDDSLDTGKPSHSSPENPTHAILDNLGIGTARVSLNGDWRAVSQPLSGVLGYSAEELLETPFLRVVQPQNPLSEREGRRRLLSGDLSAFTSEMTAIRKDGHGIWLKVVITLAREPRTHEPDHFLIAAEDLTPLKRARKALRDSERAREEVARRLINAQEIERTRIARELHDDIGQSLAVLKIQMMRAGQPVSGKPGQTHPNLPELSRKMQVVAEKVSRLSHQLHSSELEFLGLAIATKSHCREVAERYKLAIDCTCADVPDELDGTLALAFLRVTQEALHNVAKHAAAKQVKVALSSTGSELELTVIDDGVGFAVDQSGFSPGLGLISMRERLHLVGGELSISSMAGQGTRIHARAPFSAMPEVESDNL